MKAYINSIVAYSNPEHVTSFFIKHVKLTQYGMKKGLRIWGEQAVKAVQKEMKQFHNQVIMCPIDPKAMNQTDKRNALAYLMFLKEKRNGIIKGRGCADGKKQ